VINPWHISHNVVPNKQAALAEASRVDQAGDGSVINVSKAEANLRLDFWLPRIGGWRPEFRFILTPVNIEKVDRLEKLIYEAQEKIKLLERLATHNADLIGEIRAYHGDVANLAASGWAVCNGTTPAEQGIECALRNEATPNLTGGEFFKGGPVENLGRRMEATTLIVSTENVGTNYTHDPVTVPTNGSSARNAKGALPYGGKWEDPATGLKLRYSQPEMQPKSYSVVYIMKVK
jgi:hypothetical protein